MSIINTKEIKEKISFHESQISVLNQLLEISDMIEGKQPAKAKRAGAKRGRPGRPPAAGKRKQRGSVSSAVIALLENAKRPLAAGEIKGALEEQGVTRKGSASVYSTLLQMSKRGLIKKVKTAKGNAYKAGSGKPKKEAKSK